MRITNSTLLRGYNRDLNRVLELKNKSERKITSQRQFSRASESPLNAAKALNVRKSQYYSKQYQENLKVASKFYTEAETSLLQVSEQMASIRETIIAAVNSTNDGQDMKIYAQQLETKAKELCAIFNTDSAGRVIFGGESDDAQPFDILNDADGNPSIVTYHGIPINSMNDYTKFPYSNDVSVDIGLGMVTSQSSHDIDNDSVLKISFNGAEISGCGAEQGVADIDLSSVLEGRTYSLYVYAGDVKKEISFKGQPTQAENIAEINKQLQYAYRKEITYGRNYPEMDAQGVISLRDSMGDAVEGGVVSVVNNPNATRTSRLKVENDSNYSDKYRLRLSDLVEGATYKVDVQVGNGEKKTIAFEAGSDNLSDPNSPVFREDITVENFQKALDEAFGKNADGSSKVSISANDPTKGIVSSEGNIVNLYESAGSSILNSNPRTQGQALQIKTDGKTIDTSSLKDGVEYSLKITAGGTSNYVNFTYDAADPTSMEDAFKSTIFSYDSTTGEVTVTSTGEKVDSVENNRLNETAVIKSVKSDITQSQSLSLYDLNEGTTYAIDATIDGTKKTVVFTAAKSVSDTKLAIAEAFDKEFADADAKPLGKLKIDSSGKFTYTKNGTTNTLPVTLSETTAAVDAGIVKADLGQKTGYEVDYSSLEEGKQYSFKMILGSTVKDITFTAGADAAENKNIISERINAAFGTDISIDNAGKLTVNVGKTFTITNNRNDGDNDNSLFEREASFSYNYIQLTLDAARALRDGNMEYANACIDRIVSANEKLLVEIADLGCNEEFIEFNLSRLTTRDENLAERQNDLEMIDPAEEITLWKQYEAMYNACLQMSSSTVPQSIFDYIR